MALLLVSPMEANLNFVKQFDTPSTLDRQPTAIETNSSAVVTGVLTASVKDI